MARSLSPFATYGLVGLGLAGAGALATHRLAPSLPGWGAWVTGASLATLLVFGWDKLAARRGRARVPESALLGLVFVGGTPGGLAAMALFRHKTDKRSFRTTLAVVIVAQVAAAVAWHVWVRPLL